MGRNNFKKWKVFGRIGTSTGEGHGWRLPFVMRLAILFLKIYTTHTY